ncbi:MAG: Uma2 family endonuclease [Thermodesulfobacteriota bacterium]
MAETVQRQAVYEDLFSVPETMTGEIIGGELVATPRPSRKHIGAMSALGYKLGPPYQYGEGGAPGGWIILIEPEVGFGVDVLVPDLAGWKKERLPAEEGHNWISVAPDWVCEVLSPGSFRNDRIRKMPIYAQHGVPCLWHLDPLARTLEVFRLVAPGQWLLAGSYADDDPVRAEPFTEIIIDLGALWL